MDLWLLGSREQGPPRGERVCPICKARPPIPLPSAPHMTWRVPPTVLAPSLPHSLSRASDAAPSLPLTQAPPLDSFLLQARLGPLNSTATSRGDVLHLTLIVPRPQASAAALVAGRMRSGGAVRSSLSEQRQQMRLASAAAADAGAGAASAAPAGRVRRLAAAAARFAAGPGLRFIDPHEAAPPGAISRRALARAQSQARRERGAGTEV